jgi:hypothetical protein
VLLQETKKSNLRNAAFPENRRLYEISPYLTNMIVNVTDWTASEVAERQEELARLALAAWPA